MKSNEGRLLKEINEGKNRRNKRMNFHLEMNPNKEEDRNEKRKENGRAEDVFFRKFLFTIPAKVCLMKPYCKQ